MMILFAGAPGEHGGYGAILVAYMCFLFAPLWGALFIVVFGFWLNWRRKKNQDSD